MGLSQVLAQAGLPKSSLYHHFPGGKRQLAEAATLLASAEVERRIAQSFTGASTFADGAAKLCRQIAAFVSSDGSIAGCPILAIVQARDEEPRLHELSRSTLGRWTAAIAGEALRLGEADARATAALLVLQLQGAWVVSMTRQDIRAFEDLAASLECER